MGHLGDLEVSNKETELKIEIYAKKTKQDNPYWKFSPLVKVN